MKFKLAIAAAFLVLTTALVVRLHWSDLRLVYRKLPLAWLQAQRELTVHRDVAIPAAGSANLATDVYLPRKSKSGRVGTILVRLPYDKTRYGGALSWAKTFVPQGYAVVLQDMRGRFGSSGVFAPYSHAQRDGVTTLEWIAAQSWSNGKVATAGCSALGESQIMLAAASDVRHSAMIAEAAGGAIGIGGESRSYFAFFQGGIPQLSSSVGWFMNHGGKTSNAMARTGTNPRQILTKLPSGTLVSSHRDTPTDYEAFLTNFENEEYWQQLGYLTGQESFATPALHVNTWHDIGLQGTFEVAAIMRTKGSTLAVRQRQHVVIGPGNHCDFNGPFASGQVGDLEIDPAARFDYDRLYREWIAAHLVNAARPNLPAYTFYVLGANRWQTSDHWPPQGTTTEQYYLSQSGSLQRTAPEAQFVRTFNYDPLQPTPSLGGATCCTGQPDLRVGPVDQRPNVGRSDVLSFRSPRLKNAMTILGDVRLTLNFSSSAKDTDLIVILLDENQDGRLIPIQQTSLRLRYRNGYEEPTLLVPGSSTPVSIVFPPIAYEIKQGHRLALHISSSSFPRLERNMNTGAKNYLETKPVIARNTVHFGGADATRLILPVETAKQQSARPRCPEMLRDYCS